MCQTEFRYNNIFYYCLGRYIRPGSKTTLTHLSTAAQDSKKYPPLSNH